MISQINENFDETSFDPFSFTGKLALLTGAGVGAYKTFNSGLPQVNNPFNNTYHNRIKSTLNIPTVPIKSTDTAIEFARLGDIVAGKPNFNNMSYNKALEALSEATSGSLYQTGFLRQFKGLVSDFESLGYNTNTMSFQAVTAKGNNQLLEMKVSPREGYTFTVRPVTAEGDIYLGTSQPLRQAARLTIDSETEELADISTAILKEQRNRMGELLPHASDFRKRMALRPSDIEKAGLNTSIFEDVAQGRPFTDGTFIQSPSAALRRSEVLVDPFNKLHAFPGAQDAQFATLKRLVMSGALLPGSASMTASGIGVLPNSILAQVPGASLSPVGKQFFRPSKFLQGGRTPSIKLPTDELKQFSLAVVNPEDLNKFQTSLRSMSKSSRELLGLDQFNFGELAEEELLLRRDANITIGNQIYQYEIGLQDKNKQISKQLSTVLDDLAANRNVTRHELMKLMERPGGLQNLDIPATGMPLGLSTEPVGGERKLVSVMNELDQRIASMMITDKGTLKVAIKTQYQMAEFQKVFGGFKGTVKARVDTPYLLAHLEHFNRTGTIGSLEQIRNAASRYNSVDGIVSEHPYRKVLGTGALGPKETPALLQHGLLRAASGGEVGHEFLRGMGYNFDSTSGQWVSKENLNNQELLARFKKLGGPELFGAGFQTNNSFPVLETLLAPEFHRTQMGAGGRASLSQRAFMNVMAYMPEEISNNLAERLRYPLGARPQDQLTQLLNYQSLMTDSSVERLSLKDIEKVGRDIREGVLHGDINARRGAIDTALEIAGKKKGSKFAVVDLGQDVVTQDGSSFRNVVISADDVLGAYIGGKPGTGGTSLSDLDMATNNLLYAALNKGPQGLAKAGTEYQRQLNKVIDSAQDHMFKGTFTGSMFGQAQSSLAGLEKFGGGAPVIAMHRKDIARQAKELGLSADEAVKMAQSGDLWSLVSREPAEGILRTLPAKVAIAEDLGASKYHKGVIYVGDQIEFRKGLGVDFDADQLSTILFTDNKARETFNKFLITGEGEVGAIGREFLRTQKLFSQLELKGKNNLDLFDSAVDLNIVNEFILESGKTEKKLIGPLSVALQNVHEGYRHSMLTDRSSANMAKAMRGEAFALFLAEASIKAKHRPTAALRTSEDILNILNTRDVKGLQGFMDTMAFGMSGIGAELRAAEVITPQLAEKAGSLDFANAYKELTDTSTIEDFFHTQERGRFIREQNIFQKTLGPEEKLLERAMGKLGMLENELGPFFKRGLKNVTLWGILPAAGVGLAGTLMTEPEVLPIQLAAQQHDNSSKESDVVTTDSPVWVQPKKERMKISGKIMDISGSDNLNSFLSSGSVNLNIRDDRSHLSQDYIQKKINRGF